MAAVARSPPGEHAAVSRIGSAHPPPPQGGLPHPGSCIPPVDVLQCGTPAAWTRHAIKRRQCSPAAAAGAAAVARLHGRTRRRSGLAGAAHQASRQQAGNGSERGSGGGGGGGSGCRCASQTQMCTLAIVCVAAGPWISLPQGPAPAAPAAGPPAPLHSSTHLQAGHDVRAAAHRAGRARQLLAVHAAGGAGALEPGQAGTPQGRGAPHRARHAAHAGKQEGSSHGPR
jgi:hypothetical protein